MSYYGAPPPPPGSFPPSPGPFSPMYPPVGKTSGKAITALVLGIASLFTCWLGILLGIVAIVFGAVALHDVKISAGRTTGRGMAISGLVLGIISLVGWVTLLIILTVTAANDPTTFG